MGLKRVETGFRLWLPAKLQDRHGRPDLSRALVSHFIAGARCHSMAWGLVIQDEDCMASPAVLDML